MDFKISIFVLIQSVLCSEDYYWKVYDSHAPRIPIDAVQAGQDINQENLYIGQTNIWGHAGIFPTTLSRGKEVWASYGGPKQATTFIQILCSKRPKNFTWLNATSDKLHLVGMDYQIVRGGLDQDTATYVGRVNHQGNVVIGKVYSHDVNNCDMMFVFNKVEYRVKSYEILAYKA